MLLPWFKTNPAKIMFTSVAFHVITSLVFLYGRLTVRIGTLFGMCDKPEVVGRRLFVTHTRRLTQLLRLYLSYLLKPGTPRCTRRRLVAFLQTLPAKVMSITAIDRQRIVNR